MGERDVVALTVMAAVYGGVIVFANMAAAAKIEVWLLPWLVVPAGTIAYSVTFPITDIVDEIYGRRWAYRIVWGGLAAELTMLWLALVDSFIPPAPFMKAEDIYCAGKVLGLQARIVAASIIAYLVSQHHDVWAFWKWREITQGRWLWLRNNASTAVSQLIDSTLFTTIAFTGVVPLAAIPSMVLTMWLAKLLIAALDTPFVYLGVTLLQRVGVKPLVEAAPAGAR
jgi:uncharacterized integral membrane protein (TIGR00697 family)